MNPKLKRFVILLIISIAVHFPMFYLFEEDRSCVVQWGTACSNSYFLRSSFQSVFLAGILFYFTRNKKVDKQ